MKILATIVILLSTLSSYAQKEIFNKEWIVKRVSADTLLLLDKSTESLQDFIDRPCGFQDTTHYCTLAQNGAITINQVIRFCLKEWDKNLPEKQGSSQNSSSVLTSYESIELSPKETRLSLWNTSKGKYDLKRTLIAIMNTGKFDGKYRIKIIDSGSIKLISTNK
jgi:hypothetical protein